MQLIDLIDKNENSTEGIRQLISDYKIEILENLNLSQKKIF